MKFDQLRHEFMYLWVLEWKLDVELASSPLWSLTSFLELSEGPMDFEKRLVEELSISPERARQRQLTRWSATLKALRGETAAAALLLDVLSADDPLGQGVRSLICLAAKQLREAEISALAAAGGPETLRYVGHQVLGHILLENGDQNGAMQHALQSVPRSGGKEVGTGNGMSLVGELARIPSLRPQCVEFLERMRAFRDRAGGGTLGVYLEWLGKVLNA